MNIYVSPIGALGDAVRENGGGKAAAVCCSSFPVDPARLPDIPVLCLQFHDVSDEHDARAFTAQLAEEVAAFAAQHRDGDLYFCCNCGVSRSAALAAAFRRAYRCDEAAIWKNPNYSPNPLVYRLQCRALGLAPTKIGIWLRIHRNKHALRAAIRRARGKSGSSGKS